MSRKQPKHHKNHSHPHPNQQGGQQQTGDNMDVRGSIEISRSPSLEKQHQVESAEDRARENKKYLIEKLTLAVVTIYAFLTLLMYFANRKAANAAESAANTASAALKEMQKGLTLQVNIARLHNKPQIDVGAIVAYHEGEKVIWADVWCVNTGTEDAQNSRIATKAAFLTDDPTQSQRQFAESESKSEFLPLRQRGESKLQPDPHRKNLILAPNQLKLDNPSRNPQIKFYVWGEIRYSDYTKTPNDPTTFCRFKAVTAILSVKNASEGGAYNGLPPNTWSTCD